MEQTERTRFLRRLVDWRSDAGILSIYVHVDPGDRGRGWRIALRDQLRKLAEATEPHEQRRAFEAAANEVLERFPENGAPPEGRGHVGFIELGDKRPPAVWRSMQMGPRRTEVVLARRPVVRPLVELFAEGPHVGVALVSADRVRLLEWSLGAIRALEDWEITLFQPDWRERKAERAIPGRGTTTSASGHDQFDQRLEANRKRFLHEIAGLVAKEVPKRAWTHLLAFGVDDLPNEFAEGLGDAARRTHLVRHDLVSSKEAQVADRVAEQVRAINAGKALDLVREVEEAVGASPGTTLGPEETYEALMAGRVRHLVFDGNREFEEPPSTSEAAAAHDDGRDGMPIGERMVELAVATDAEVTPLCAEPAERLQPHDGVAGLLRY
jgi:hypothetical protein